MKLQFLIVTVISQTNQLDALQAQPVTHPVLEVSLSSPSTSGLTIWSNSCQLADLLLLKLLLRIFRYPNFHAPMDVPRKTCGW